MEPGKPLRGGRVANRRYDNDTRATLDFVGRDMHVPFWFTTECYAIFFHVDLGLSSSERKRLSHVLTSMHVAVTDQQIGKSCINNWTYKNFVERYCVTQDFTLERNCACLIL